MKEVFFLTHEGSLLPYLEKQASLLPPKEVAYFFRRTKTLRLPWGIVKKPLPYLEKF
jgi:hypothetical protein